MTIIIIITMIIIFSLAMPTSTISEIGSRSARSGGLFGILPVLIVNMHKKIRISCLQRNCSVIISVKHIFFGNIPNYDVGTVLPGIVPIRIFWCLCQNKAEVTAMSIFEFDEEGV